MSSTSDHNVSARYEYRVWGEYRKARKLMEKLGSVDDSEEVRDCYLITDDASFNAKVRGNTLKIKELVSEVKGFERWTSDRYRTADSAPSPFDVLFDELKLDRPQQGKKYDLERAIAKLDPDHGVRAVFVTKKRQNYRIGSLRAEVTDIEVEDTDEVLRTLAIEGDNLDDLVALRKKLGLRGEENIAMHQVIDVTHDAELRRSA